MRSVKKGLREKHSKSLEVTGGGNEGLEIDFPTEWLRKVEKKDNPSDKDGDAEGSGGCPTTATNAK